MKINEILFIIVCITLGIGTCILIYIDITDTDENDKNIDLNKCLEEKIMWENRATDNLKLIQNYCGNLNKEYKYVIYNMSECSIFQPNGVDYQQVICDREKSLFAIEK